MALRRVEAAISNVPSSEQLFRTRDLVDGPMTEDTCADVISEVPMFGVHSGGSDVWSAFRGFRCLECMAFRSAFRCSVNSIKQVLYYRFLVFWPLSQQRQHVVRDDNID